MVERVRNSARAATCGQAPSSCIGANLFDQHDGSPALRVRPTGRTPRRTCAPARPAGPSPLNDAGRPRTPKPNGRRIRSITGARTVATARRRRGLALPASPGHSATFVALLGKRGQPKGSDTSRLVARSAGGGVVYSGTSAMHVEGHSQRGAVVTAGYAAPMSIDWPAVAAIGAAVILAGATLAGPWLTRRRVQLGTDSIRADLEVAQLLPEGDLKAWTVEYASLRLRKMHLTETKPQLPVGYSGMANFYAAAIIAFLLYLISDDRYQWPTYNPSEKISAVVVNGLFALASFGIYRKLRSMGKEEKLRTGLKGSGKFNYDPEFDGLRKRLELLDETLRETTTIADEVEPEPEGAWAPTSPKGDRRTVPVEEVGDKSD